MDQMPEILKWMPGAGSSADDPRFLFNVGEHVRVSNLAVVRPDGVICQIMWRRNGYPPPYFDCWFPIYFVERLEDGDGGGEVGEGCLERLQ